MADHHPGTTNVIGEVMIEPHAQQQVSLGNFGPRKHPQGFSVEFNPEPQPVESVMTKVLSTGTPHRYELVMQINNNGSKTIAAKIVAL